MVRVCVDGQSWHSVVVVVDEPVAAPLDAVVAGLAAAELVEVEVEVGMVVVAVHSVVDVECQCHVIGHLEVMVQFLQSHFVHRM